MRPRHVHLHLHLEQVVDRVGQGGAGWNEAAAEAVVHCMKRNVACKMLTWREEKERLEYLTQTGVYTQHTTTFMRETEGLAGHTTREGILLPANGP